MTGTIRTHLSAIERDTLAAALDALLPSSGSFPAPSATDMLDEFILEQVSPAGASEMYPGLDLDALREILQGLGGQPDIDKGLRHLERDAPARFQALWALAVYGYYSRSEVTSAIQRDLAPGYNGAPLPRGYTHLVAPWDDGDRLQMPRRPSGRYIRTEDVRRVDLSALDRSDA